MKLFSVIPRSRWRRPQSGRRRWRSWAGGSRRWRCRRRSSSGPHRPWRTSAAPSTDTARSCSHCQVSTVRSALSGTAIIPVLLAWQVSVHSSDCYVRLREAEEKYQTQTHQTEQHTGGREGSFYGKIVKEHTIYREGASE